MFVKIILVFVGIILFIVGLSLIVAFFAGLFGFGHQIFILDSDLIFISFPTLVDLILGEAGSNAFLVMGIVLLLGIPLFMILYGGIRLIFGIERRRYVGRVAINLWLAGLILTGYYGYKIAKSFRQEGITESNISMVVPQDSTIRLSVKSDPDFDRILKFGDYVEVKDMNMILTSKDTGFFYGIPRFEIERYNGSMAELEIIKGARGKSTMDAGNRASQTIYSITRSGDSLLLFDPFFKLPEHDVWRRQQVDLVLKVPEGIKIKFDQNMNSFLNRNYITRKYAGKTWIMTETGLSEIGQ